MTEEQVLQNRIKHHCTIIIYKRSNKNIRKHYVYFPVDFALKLSIASLLFGDTSHSPPKMNHLPEEVLAVVCNCLPWKEKLASRSLSTKWGSLLRDPIQLDGYSMKQEKLGLTLFLVTPIFRKNSPSSYLLYRKKLRE